MAGADYASSVFINCPFDPAYEPILDALIFAVLDCGFIPRCALEVEDSSEIRLEKIFRIIDESKFGIHDLSRTELDSKTNLPRFNMPFELGIFMGAKRFGSRNNRGKSCLITDRARYRYQKFVSDIAGHDIKAHKNRPKDVVSAVRDYLDAASRRRTVPGGREIWDRYKRYRRELPRLCAEIPLEIDEMTFNNKANFAEIWLRNEE